MKRSTAQLWGQAPSQYIIVYTIDITLAIVEFGFNIAHVSSSEIAPL
jgi:hypothetical protein